MTLLGDRYELGAVLGRGGMSTVVRALDVRLQRPVAVKLLREHLLDDPTARIRFEREARSVATLHSPNIVQVYDVGIDGDRPYIAMELVEGETLADRLAREGPLAPEEAVTVVDALLAALEEAHRAGIAHRDVKPGNVLLPSSGGLKLADFGIAKSATAQASSLTVAGEVLGTPTYLSPEQVGGQEATPASDVYAAGVVLYEMLAGRPPFVGDEPLTIALAHQSRSPTPLRQAAPGVPEPLAAVVDLALVKDPGERYPDAGALRAAVQAAHGGPGAAATAPGTTAVLAGAGGAAGDETAVMPGPLPPPTAVVAAGAATVPAAGRPGRSGRWVWWLVAAAVLLVLIALAVALLGDDDTAPDGTDDTIPPPTEAPVEPAPDPTAPPETQPPATAPPETEPPTTAPPETEPPTTAPPETEPPGPPDDVPPDEPPGQDPTDEQG